MTDLYDYLKTESDDEIYRSITTGFYKNVFLDHLEFFGLLEQQINFAKSNLENPRRIIEKLLTLPLNEGQLSFLFAAMLAKISRDSDLLTNKDLARFNKWVWGSLERIFSQ